MYLDQLRQKKGLSVYELAKRSGVAYSTLNELCKEKTKLHKANAETLWKLAHALEVSMEDLLAPYMEKRADFENFKSAVCHRLRRLGDVDFMMDLLQSGQIQDYYDKGYYAESFYLLAMLDYLCRENQLPLCVDFAHLRSQKLAKPLYPRSLQARALLKGDDSLLFASHKEAIPEFLQFNIIEGEVRNVL